MLIVLDAKNSLVSSAFRRFGTVRVLATPEITRDTVRDADALIIRSDTTVDASLLEGTHVRFVGTATIGTDHVDLEYLRRSGIRFASAPGSNATSVAEYVLAALLVVAEADGMELSALTIGIVGVGNVGSRVERMARALGMRVLLNDPPLGRATGDNRFLPLEELMGADIVTLHVPLTREGEDATFHLFDAARIGRMKQGSLLVNTARGGVVDTSALVRALAGGHLGGAILDVWEGEPAIDTDLLRASTLATPHVAGYSLDGRLNAARMLFEALRDFSGHDVSWSLPEDVPPPEHPVIRLPTTPGTFQQALSFAVRHCYDVERDDADLRAMVALDAAERARHFQRLRSGYRVRREFSSSRVIFSPGGRSYGDMFSVLGFLVDPK